MTATSSPTSLKEARAAASLTQEDVAVHCGLTAPAVSQWEVGATIPSGPSRRLLAQLFSVDVATVDSWFEAERATA